MYKYPSLLLCTVLFLSAGCNKDNDSPRFMGHGIDSYKPKYMHYNSGSVMSDTAEVRLEYNGDQIIKRVGGFLAWPPTWPYFYLFKADVYDEITYSSNEAVMVQKYDSPDPDVNYISDEKKFLFSHGKILECTITRGYSNNKDTIKYYYKNNLLIKRVAYRRKGVVYQSDYYYNDRRNIDSIITRYAIPNPVTGNLEFNRTETQRVKETFLDFDNYANPLKNLMIFDETFNRSLSENNYREYRKNEYDDNGTETALEKRNWNFTYENGQIDFSK